MSDDFPIRPWKHDYNEEDKRLHEHGYHHVEGLEGVWQNPLGQADSLLAVAKCCGVLRRR